MSSQIRLAFFGSRHAFDYNHIGGTDSLVRRLAHALAGYSDVAHVGLITYGHRSSSKELHLPYLDSYRYQSLEQALSALRNYDHVITVYLLPRDRISYTRFRWQQRKCSQRFHMLYQGWPEHFWRRELSFLDARLFRYNGRLFGVSRRLVSRLKRIDSNAQLLWPPVPDHYFVNPADKKTGQPLQVTFLGRIDPGKGVIETINLFSALSRHNDIVLNFYGMHWPHNEESVRLHQELLIQNDFPYHHADFQGYSQSVDELVADVLAQTDILVQPYRRLSSAIDTPLLILEAMASLAAVLTRPLGEIPDVYGDSPFLINSFDDVSHVVQVVLDARGHLLRERARIVRQNEKLKFDVETVASKFMQVLNEA